MKHSKLQFTLIELMVGMAMFVVLMGFLFVFLDHAKQMLHDTKNRNEAFFQSNTVFHAISRDLSHAVIQADAANFVNNAFDCRISDYPIMWYGDWEFESSHPVHVLAFVTSPVFNEDRRHHLVIYCFVRHIVEESGDYYVLAPDEGVAVNRRRQIQEMYRGFAQYSNCVYRWEFTEGDYGQDMDNVPSGGLLNDWKIWAFRNARVINSLGAISDNFADLPASEQEYGSGLSLFGTTGGTGDRLLRFLTPDFGVVNPYDPFKYGELIADNVTDFNFSCVINGYGTDGTPWYACNGNGANEANWVRANRYYLSNVKPDYVVFTLHFADNNAVDDDDAADVSTIATRTLVDVLPLQ